MNNIYFGEFETREQDTFKISKAIVKTMKLPKKIEVELLIVSSEEIRQINNETRGIDKETDVLSFPNMELMTKPFKISDFPFDINHETGNLNLGSIIICKDVMERQAAEYGTYEREFLYLLVHGTLHLLGYDHMNETDKKAMREKEELILTVAK